MRAITFYNGQWTEDNTPHIGPTSHSFLYAHSVFDGVRVFQGLVPDLDRHCERLLYSAAQLKLTSPVGLEEIMALSLEGIERITTNDDLYIRPVVFSGSNGRVGVTETPPTEFMISVFKSTMPTAEKGISAALSTLRRPHPLTAPTKAKSTCLYSNTILAIREVAARGFNVPVMRDLDGNVLEFSSANLWYAKNGTVVTPAPEDTYLNGITRQRVKALFEKSGVAVVEKRTSVEDLQTADEIFMTGNYGKVNWISRYEDRHLEPGPFFHLARRLYWEFAQTQPIEYFRDRLQKKSA